MTTQEQIQQMIQSLQMKAIKADDDASKFVTYSCAEIERVAKTLMRDAATNPNVAYGSKGHHPSMPGEAPAPDTGTLLQSITHSIDRKGNEAVGYVGSVLKDPEYPKFLEYGTTKMKPRPWLSAALIKCQSFMSNLMRSLFR